MTTFLYQYGVVVECTSGPILSLVHQFSLRTIKFFPVSLSVAVYLVAWSKAFNDSEYYFKGNEILSSFVYIKCILSSSANQFYKSKCIIRTLLKKIWLYFHIHT